jgi:glutaredoxin
MTKNIQLYFIANVVLLLQVTAVNAIELYKSVGPDGKIIYSDRPSAEAKLEKKLVLKDLPASQLSTETAAAIDRLRQNAPQLPKAANASDTVLFTTSWCGYCKKARAYLASKNIPYQEIDIETEDGLSAYVRAGGTQGVPMLVSKGQSIMGFTADEYDRIFQ